MSFRMTRGVVARLSRERQSRWWCLGARRAASCLLPSSPRKDHPSLRQVSTCMCNIPAQPSGCRVALIVAFSNLEARLVTRLTSRAIWICAANDARISDSRWRRLLCAVGAPETSSASRSVSGLGLGVQLVLVDE